MVWQNIKKGVRMRKALFAIMAIAVIAAVASCKNDPVHGTIPVDTSFWAGNVVNAQGDTIRSTVDAYFPLDEFRALGEKNDTAAQRAMVNQYRKVLTANVVAHYPQIKDEKNIHFILGSGYARKVRSGDGKTYNGRFKNELIIIIFDQHVKDTLFLACGNGMLQPLEFKSQSDLGTAEQWRFTIKEGEGLATYIPILTEWGRTAEDLGIPIRDKKKRNVVSSDTYLNYLGEWESILFAGDVIDLVANEVYNKAGQEVDFARRIAETEKENARRAAAAKKRRHR